MTKFTIDDVLAHLFGAIEDKEKRRQLEQARREDPRVAWWFRELRTSIVAATAENEETSTVTAEPPNAAQPQEPDTDVSPEALAAVRAMFRESSPAPAPTAGTSMLDLALRLDELTPGHDDASRPSPRWRGFWVAAPLVDYVSRGRSKDDPRPPRNVPINAPKTDREGNICLWLACDDQGHIVDEHIPKPVPYAVVLVELVERSTERILGCKLVALPLYHGPQGKYRSVVIPLDEIAGDASPKQVEKRVYPADDDRLPKFREHLDELDRLSASPGVSNDEELRDNLMALKKRLTEQD